MKNDDLTELTVFIVDDDPAVRDALGLLLGIRGYRSAMFASGEAFLQAWQPHWSGCLLIDIRMSGMDGLTLQRELGKAGCSIPVIIISGHGDVALARQAFKAHASDFLEKPFDDAKLMAAIDEALSREQKHRIDNERKARGRTLLRSLTPREREVLGMVAAGMHNRDIGPALGISVRTVEAHKARLMAKLGLDNVAGLVRLSMQDAED
jgi:RNA polymerase sigma factor (sigma-70 family)